MPQDRPIVLLDACCVINLYATGQFGEILSALPYQFGIARKVGEESLYVRIPGTREKNPINLTQWIIDGVLAEYDLEDEEKESAVYLATQVDDGEAATISIAHHRDFAIATDDQKAIDLIQSLSLIYMTTLSLLKEWSDACEIQEIEMSRILHHIRTKAVYEPPRADPLRSWWESIIGHFLS